LAQQNFGAQNKIGALPQIPPRNYGPESFHILPDTMGVGRSQGPLVF